MSLASHLALVFFFFVGLILLVDASRDAQWMSAATTFVKAKGSAIYSNESASADISAPASGRQSIIDLGFGVYKMCPFPFSYLHECQTNDECKQTGCCAMYAFPGMGQRRPCCVPSRLTLVARVGRLCIKGSGDDIKPDSAGGEDNDICPARFLFQWHCGEECESNDDCKEPGEACCEVTCREHGELGWGHYCYPIHDTIHNNTKPIKTKPHKHPSTGDDHHGVVVHDNHRPNLAFYKPTVVHDNHHKPSNIQHFIHQHFSVDRHKPVKDKDHKYYTNNHHKPLKDQAFHEQLLQHIQHVLPFRIN